jgi:hypothetical protein
MTLSPALLMTLVLGLPPLQAANPPPSSTTVPSDSAASVEPSPAPAQNPADAPPLPSPSPQKKEPLQKPPDGPPPLSPPGEPAPPAAELTHDEPAADRYTVDMMFQLRYQQTAVNIVPGLDSLVRQEYPNPAVAEETLRAIRDTARAQDGVRIHRAYLRLGTRPLDNLRGEVLLDFARLWTEEDKGQMVRTAFADFVPIKNVSLQLGIQDIPFSLLELFDHFNEAKLELSEMGPTHELLHHLGLAGRDIGAVVEVAPLTERRWLHLHGGVLNGGASGGQTYRGPGLLALRAISQPIPEIQIGAGLVGRPSAIDVWWEELRFRYQEHDKGLAYSADVIVTTGPFVFRAEWLTGDRTDNDVVVPLKQRRGDARTFMSAWGMGAARFPVGRYHLIPAFRLEWLDVDREHSDVGGIIHVSAALTLELSQRLRVLADLSRHFVQYGTRNWHFERIRYDTDYTAGTLQFQLRL